MEIRQLLEFAAEPTQSCAQVDALLDKHIAYVHERLEALRNLNQQLVALRARCDGDASHSCAILSSFMGASSEAETDCCDSSCGLPEKSDVMKKINKKSASCLEADFLIFTT